MPEGPEIRYLCEKIKSIIMNKTLIKITALSKRKVNIPKELKVFDVKTKGKLMYLRCESDYFIHIHCGLAGWIYLSEQKYTKYILYFKNNLNIYLDDMRKLSKITVLKKTQHESIISELGPDILSDNFVLNNFRDKILGTNQMIASHLLDQHNYSGIGNYIKNESLYISKINPKRITSSLNDNEIIMLYNSIRFVAFSNLVEELNNGNIKIPEDIKKISPKKLNVPYKLRVYEKNKDQYGNKVTFEIIGGRKTYYVKGRQI